MRTEEQREEGEEGSQTEGGTVGGEGRPKQEVKRHDTADHGLCVSVEDESNVGSLSGNVSGEQTHLHTPLMRRRRSRAAAALHLCL